VGVASPDAYGPRVSYGKNEWQGGFTGNATHPGKEKRRRRDTLRRRFFRGPRGPRVLRVLRDYMDCGTMGSR
jgi:hypothetical protein